MTLKAPLKGHTTLAGLVPIVIETDAPIYPTGSSPPYASSIEENWRIQIRFHHHLNPANAPAIRRKDACCQQGQIHVRLQLMVIELEFLKRIPYFSDLDIDELNSIRKLVFEKTVERGDIILLEDEPADRLYFVASGAVKVFKTSVEGKEQILSILRPGESFNDVPIFDGEPNPASAQAMGPVVLYGIRKGNVDAMLQQHPRAALNVIRVLASRVRQLVSLVEDLSFRQVSGRVARIILEHAGDGTRPAPRLTQQDMAAMAGTVREVVGRSLKAMEEEGMIKLDHHRIVITDKKGLKEMIETLS